MNTFKWIQGTETHPSRNPDWLFCVVDDTTIGDSDGDAAAIRIDYTDGDGDPAKWHTCCYNPNTEGWHQWHTFDPAMTLEEVKLAIENMLRVGANLSWEQPL